ncbi:hypothetical protein LOC54_10090 [Acetobacter sp. AN02]|uniref:hypothetical protein n=1 Tax=Acetobacter sp. AN02 TaxID=2894186 RepID=UPI0024340C2A|nr:hypothetical protein [Acetobacter sp. AN02]MDG6095446.1 hypothetical protein [Acetobacter sp. AN02]
MLHPATHGLAEGIMFPFLPVALNFIALTCRRYPASLHGHTHPHEPPCCASRGPLHPTRMDVPALLQETNNRLDVDEGDIEAPLLRVERVAELCGHAPARKRS